MINLREGNTVDGVNGVDFTLPREDLGRMNTDLQDTVNRDTYACWYIYISVSLKRVFTAIAHFLYTTESLFSQEGPGARGKFLFTPFDPLHDC